MRLPLWERCGKLMEATVYSANYVPVGSDQKQHIEFSREVAKGFNHLFGPVLTVPEPLICKPSITLPYHSCPIPYLTQNAL